MHQLPNEAVTHNGRFHADDVFSAALLEILNPEIHISRVSAVPKNFDPADGQISVYKFHYDPNILAYFFQEPSIEWLHFVAANRKKDLFPQLLKKYSVIDIIGGKIADDQTARTLQIYISGEGAGEPGTPKADKETIEKLLPNRLKDQFCFRTQDAVEHLEFVRSDRYGDIKL